MSIKVFKRGDVSYRSIVPNRFLHLQHYSSTVQQNCPSDFAQAIRFLPRVLPHARVQKAPPSCPALTEVTHPPKNPHPWPHAPAIPCLSVRRLHRLPSGAPTRLRPQPAARREKHPAGRFSARPYAVAGTASPSSRISRRTTLAATRPPATADTTP